MKEIVKYVSTDGTEWDDEMSARRRDYIDSEVKEIMASLPKMPEYSWVRVSVAKDVVLKAKQRIVDICRREYPTQPVFQHPAQDINEWSYAGRFLSDVGGPLNQAWFWFSCHRDGWLYEQPFYALNPDKFDPRDPRDPRETR